MPGEEALYKWIGSVLDAAAKDPKIKQLLKEIPLSRPSREMIDPFFQWALHLRPAGNGFNSPVNGAQWGTDHLNRTATAKSNMYDNRPRRPSTSTRTMIARASSSTAKTPTRSPCQGAAGQGVLVFDPLQRRAYVPSPTRWNRYSLGTKDKNLKYNADGSLTLYASAKSPGADKESNWLPAPNGTFSLYIRAPTGPTRPSWTAPGSRRRSR